MSQPERPVDVVPGGHPATPGAASLTEALARAPSLREAARGLVEHTARTLGGDGGALFLWDEDAAHLWQVYCLAELSARTPRVVQPFEGVAGTVFAGSGSGLLVSSYPTWSSAIPQTVETQEVIGVLVELGGQRLGSLLATSTSVRGWTDADVETASGIAAAAAPLLALWRLAEDAAARREEARVLTDLMREAAVQTNPEQILDLISQRLAELLAATHSTGIVLVRDGRRLEPHAVRGWPSPPVAEAAGSLTERTLREGRTLIAVTDPLLQDVDIADFPLVAERGARTVLMTPLRSHGDLEGALFATWSERVTIAPWRVRLAEALAYHAGAVLERMRLQANLADLAGRFLRGQGTPPPVITNRERQLLVLTAQGRTGPEIADELGLTKQTVEQYMKRLMAKLGAPSRAAAVARALAWDLIGHHEVEDEPG